MTNFRYAPLPSRALLTLNGEETRPFLQGLISNDMDKVAPNRAIWAALLTPQGKYLHDFFVAEIEGLIYLDCEAERRADLKKRLMMYRLRTKIDIEDSDDFEIGVVYGDGAPGAMGLSDEAGRAVSVNQGIAFVDPRLGGAGVRVIGASPPDIAPGTAEDYDALRLSLGLPDGSRDLTVEKSTLLESGFEELNGVDFDKGCYMGQELTARTKYRGLVKKRLMPVTIVGPLPESGTEILQDGKNAGEMRSSGNGQGIALIRLECFDSTAELTAGDATITPKKPDWAAF